MPYQSVDVLQNILSEEVFGYTKDSKKAAGRALGTLVEIITLYLLKTWGVEKSISIESSLPEYANLGITHNVEYTLHGCKSTKEIDFSITNLPITPAKILGRKRADEQFKRKTNKLLTRNMIVRNSCKIAESDDIFLNAYLKGIDQTRIYLDVVGLFKNPFAMFECKRVGVEEGNKKGPQTIEKAKQGAYVSKTVSSLQRIRMKDGSIGGFIQQEDGSYIIDDYYKLLNNIISGDNKELLRFFILTVGIVSNHGNWFTSENHNKEMKVLAQSYDWLLFLSDYGLSEFITQIIREPEKEYAEVGRAFCSSYTGKKGYNFFTKVNMLYEVDLLLQKYFRNNINKIEKWFKIIAPCNREIDSLRNELRYLSNKNWEEIYK